MEVYFYSPSNNQFLAGSMLDDYKKSGSWPDDAFEISDNVYQKFGANPAPAGKIMIAGENGYPEWSEQPPPDKHELKAIAESYKYSQLNYAAQRISLLQDAVELGLATDEEGDLLLEWKEYRVLLNRVDTDMAPEINWPETPENVA